ncbi:peptide ABC transporter substrate-binding protein [Caproiciproducens sp. R1]|uniref:peptide ABC transporter substrate-binding protein n=1 Tax=Caproiciproducens sp. R1 TaxID=3435000 RepID=UPI0040335C97
MLKRMTAALLCLTILFSFSGCGKNEPKNANKKINYYLDSEPKTLDPQIASDSAATVAVEALFEGLVRLGADNRPYPGVAEKWVSSENDTVFTFTLRSSAKWSDKEKTPVTANDFVYAFRRALSPQTGSPTCSRMFCIQNAREVNAGTVPADQLGVTAPDAHTLVVRLNYSYPDFPSITAAPVFMPCNQKFFESTSGRYGLEIKYLIGNGPFEIDGKYGWSHGQYLNLVRSDTYAGKQKPLPSNLKLTVQNKDNAITDPVDALKSGTVDAIAISGSQAAAAQAQGCTITSFEDTTWGLCFNTQSELMKSKNIRRAFIQAFDRAKVLQHLPKNMSAANDIIPPSTALLGKPYRSLAGGGSYFLKQDKNAASLLAAGLSELSLSELKSVTVICPDDANVKLMLNEMIASWNVQFHNYFNMEPLSEDQLASRIQSGDYQVALCPVQPASDGPLSVLSLFKSSEKNNPAKWKDSSFDAMLDSAEKSGGADSAAIFANAEKYLNEQGVFYPLYYEKHYYASSKGVTGVVFHPYGAGVDFIQAGKE